MDAGSERLRVYGEVSEWLKEHAWRACVGETPPRVRIPASPPASAGAPWGPRQLNFSLAQPVRAVGAGWLMPR